MAEAKPTFKDRALRVIAVIGLVALLLLGAWGIIQIAFTLYGFLGNGAASSSPSAQTQGTEKIVVAVPPTLQSGTPFTLSFTHQNAPGNYAYQISYSCANGLSVQAPLPTGSTQTVPCNTPFNYTNATANMQLVAAVSGTSPVSTTFTVSAKNLANGAITASGTANSTVAPGAPAANPLSQQASQPGSPASLGGGSSGHYTPASRKAALSGLPDLAVTMGATQNLGGGQYASHFTIQNVGTNVAPSGWTFNAALPMSYTYTSNAQQALYPGDKIAYTLTFTLQNQTYGYSNSYGYQPYANTYYPANCAYSQSYTYNGVYNYPSYQYGCNTNTAYNYSSYYSYGSNTVMVSVDPNNSVPESSKANNTASAAVY